MSPEIHRLHQSAQELSRKFRDCESQLLSLLIVIDKKKAYLPLGFNSLFQYCVSYLKLNESQSHAFMAVARKSNEVPELKQAVENQEMSLSNARRLVSVITPENKDGWLEKGKTLSQKALEKEVVKVNPMPPVVEKIRPVSAEESELKVGLTPEIEQKLKRVQALLGTSSSKEALNAMLDEYLKRHDPVERAERQKASEPNQLCSNTVARVASRHIPRAVFHEVQRRDRGKCQFKSSDGRRCLSEYWVEVHHIRPWAMGGKHEMANLMTLCQKHHAYFHRQI